MHKSIHQKIDGEPGLTAFTRRVYHIVAEIPRGAVMTYAKVARAIGKPKAVRAVGNALNRNPLAPEVPCHRVTRSDGSIGGFVSGTAAKYRLLRKEGAM